MSTSNGGRWATRVRNSGRVEFRPAPADSIPTESMQASGPRPR
ncbi:MULTISPECIES: hypothetical protein [Amycolatopsis]|nr:MULTISPECIES: hypothetical protein [Amycolatopsis]